jgi:hypothetical protein
MPSSGWKSSIANKQQEIINIFLQVWQFNLDHCKLQKI